MCTAWEGKGCLSACVSISRAAALIDEAIEAGEFATNQHCCYESWLASLQCSDLYNVSTALSEFTQQFLTSVVKGQLKNVIILTTQLAWLVRKDFLHTYAEAQTLTSSASPFAAQPLSSHATQSHRHTPMLTHNPSPPAANKNIKNEDSEMRWDGVSCHSTGGSLGNIQPVLPQAKKSNRGSLQR